MSGRRLALVIATSSYRDPRLQKLRSPGSDARILAKLLADNEIGGFDTTVLINRPVRALARAVEEFYQKARLDDLVVTHIACHGVKDEDGNLYYTGRDTELAYLEATGLSANFINRQMARSRCQRKVLLLDCCYSGAFSRELTARGGGALDLKERFNGRGQVVLTASSPIEYAFEREAVTGEGVASIFTAAIISGIKDGSADRDGDGWVSIDELFEHVERVVAQETPNQTPRKWNFDVQGTIMIARNPAGLVSPHGPYENMDGPYKKESLLGPDLRIYAGASRPTSEHSVVVTGLETSLAYQGKRVALDREAYAVELRKRGTPENEAGQFGYTHAAMVEVIAKVGVPSDPPGRLYRARLTNVRSGRDIIKQLTLGRPVVAHAMIREPWLDPKVQADGRLPEDIGQYPYQGGKTLLILGWDKVQDMFAMLMPWPEWGDRGYGWIPNGRRLLGDYINEPAAIEAYEVSH
jgi:uncharacterized caspase-like protein